MNGGLWFLAILYSFATGFTLVEGIHFLVFATRERDLLGWLGAMVFLGLPTGCSLVVWVVLSNEGTPWAYFLSASAAIVGGVASRAGGIRFKRRWSQG